ncbi:uncharacterized protein LOC108629130, partial [Ceratina calcarata]
RLEEHTVEALSSLSKGNEALLEQQKYLKDAQASAYNLVTSNLRELNNEKALIRSGHTQLAAMTDDIRKKLEEANRNLKQQAIEHGENHKEILEDLVNIQMQAELIWEKIESSTERIFAQHEEALSRYERTLEKLAQINDTVQYIWNITNSMRAEVDEKLNWLTNYIGDTGEQMHRIYRIGLHVVYLLCCMVIAAFLHAPLLTRITIMGLVPMNLVSYLKHGMDACLDFPSITVLIILITMMHFLMVGIQRLFGPKQQMRAEPVQVIERNGHANGHYVSSSYSNLQSEQTPNLTFYAKQKRNVRALYYSLSYQINRCIRIVRSLVESVISWSKQSWPQREELSCSYTSSRRTREDLIRNYESEFPSISEDMTDFEHSHLVNESNDDLDKLIDANDLRRRMQRQMRGASTYSSHQQSSSRSVTPSFTTRCAAITKSGRKCRMHTTNDRYCARHIGGYSVTED